MNEQKGQLPITMNRCTTYIRCWSSILAVSTATHFLTKQNCSSSQTGAMRGLTPGFQEAVENCGYLFVASIMLNICYVDCCLSYISNAHDSPLFLGQVVILVQAVLSLLGVLHHFGCVMLCRWPLLLLDVAPQVPDAKTKWFRVFQVTMLKSLTVLLLQQQQSGCCPACEGTSCTAEAPTCDAQHWCFLCDVNVLDCTDTGADHARSLLGLRKHRGNFALPKTAAIMPNVSFT
jgi:hypothetical protein